MVKKQKFKKNKKKFMQVRAKLRLIKNQKDTLRKLNLISDRFMRKVPGDELQILQQVVRKLIEHSEETKE